jgi:hypothetical protein
VSVKLVDIPKKKKEVGERKRKYPKMQASKRSSEHEKKNAEVSVRA